MSKTARLVKVIKNAERRPLGLLRGADGRQIEGPEETLELLLQSHFPHCSNETRVDRSDPNRQVQRQMMKKSYMDFISVDMMEVVIKSLGPDKAPGPDGLPARVLRHIGH